MPNKGHIFQKKELTLTEDEKVQYQDYLDAGESTARYAIWGYVEENEPIPNELKPILLEILQRGFKGKSKTETAAYWEIIIKDILREITLNGLTQKNAIKCVSAKNSEKIETVERRYKSSQYRKLKDDFIKAHEGAE